nr:DHH family phosphoesterase [Candidatus Shapirobacteria bacterium]
MQTIDSTWSPLKIIELLAENRHIADLKTFLSPEFPKSNLKLKKAVTIINQSIKNGENILIYGDYDVDGITATAILWQALYSHTKKVTPFVPHREHDGYGLKATSFFRFQEEKGIKFDLLITVDNGIVADKEIKKILDKQKIKIIITDHH